MAIDLATSQPRNLPITVDQYRLLVEHGTFAQRMGQVELIYGRIVEMNPQGPLHARQCDVTSTVAPQCLPTAHLAVARLFSDVTK